MQRKAHRIAINRRSVLRAGVVCSIGCIADQALGKSRVFSDISSFHERNAQMLDNEFSDLIERLNVPGLAAAIIVDGQLEWAKGYGWASIEDRRPMTADTIQNVGSVTKTVTTTLALQDLEAQRLGLDSDINEYLDFSVRNPNHPDVPITLRQLLSHRSSIRDGVAYLESYRCGDQTVTLENWLRSYFVTSATSDRFHSWAPGTVNPPNLVAAYSNVAFGLIGLLSERVSGRPYEALCRDRIFNPLGMTSTGFSLNSIDRSREAVPYKTLAKDATDKDVSPPERALARYPDIALNGGGHFPYCSYSFATPPDGLMRTNVRDLAKFMLAWIGNGTLMQHGGKVARLLSAETVTKALSPVHFERALGWHEVHNYFGSNDPIVGSKLMGHNGRDPGIGSVALFRPEDRSGFVMIFNTSYDDAIARDGLKIYLEALASQ